MRHPSRSHRCPDCGRRRRGFIGLGTACCDCGASGCTDKCPCQDAFASFSVAQLNAATPEVVLAGFSSTPGAAGCGQPGATGAGVLNGTHELPVLGSGVIISDPFPPITRDGCRNAHYRKEIIDPGTVSPDSVGFVSFVFDGTAYAVADCGTFCNATPATGRGCFASAWYRHRADLGNPGAHAVEAIWEYDGSTWTECDSDACNNCTGATIGSLTSVSFPE